MWVELDRFSRVLMDAALAAVILLSLAVLAMLACQQPARRIVVAKTAIVLAALLIPLVAGNPFRRQNILAWFIPDRPAHAESRGSPPAPGGTIERPPGDVVKADAGTSPFNPKTLAWTDWGRGLVVWITLGYIAGASLGMSWFLLGLWGIRRMVHDAPAPGAATQAIYAEVAESLGQMESLPRLRVTHRVNRPVVAGLWRPSILIPPKYNTPDFDRESLRIILLHELAHAEQGDSRFSAVASLAQSLWFFLPHVWWLLRQLRIDQEFLADQRSAELIGSSATYATLLVELAGSRNWAPNHAPAGETILIAENAPIPGWWWAGGFHSPLLQRVVMLLHSPFRVESRPPTWWRIAAPSLGLGLAILCSSWSVSLPIKPAAGVSPLAPALLTAGGEGHFHVPHFVAVPQVVSRSGRSHAYVFPVILREHFVVDVEIQSSSSNLLLTRLAGVPLASPDRQNESIPRTLGDHGPVPTWRRIHLQRDGDRLSLHVDDANIPVGAHFAELARWLSIEPPPDATVVLRNLTVEW